MHHRLPLNAMKNNLIPLENFFAATLEETLDEWPTTMTEVAIATGIPLPHLSGMKTGKRRCTPEYDLRLSRFFGTSRGYWMRLQLAYDMDRTLRAKGSEIDRSVNAAAK
jgi:antitoxin HigA-1